MNIPIKEYEKKQLRVQKKLEALLTKEGFALVAQYNKETNMILMEVVPLEVLEQRNAVMAELLKSKGDKIESNVEIPTN